MTRPASLRHALAVAGGFTLLFSWVYLAPILEGSFLAESDIYEQFLPVFLSPITWWSSYEFGGMPAFADPQDTAFYPLDFFFARVTGSWTAYIISAYVMAACFTYAYVFSVTRSRLAAAFAGLAFGLSEAMMERIAHVTTIHAVAWFPLLLLAIDRLRSGGASLLWVAIGAFAIGSCILGGHPQIVLYLMYTCGLYALAGGIFERAGWKYFARVGAALALGVLLTAVKTIPLMETTALTARQSLDFGAFVSHANTPAQMLSALFPAIVHEGREAPTYVGLATLVFAMAAVFGRLRSWRVFFWLGIAVISMLIGVGDATPVSRLAFELPLYDRFRVSARHLILASFGAVALAGFGVAALRRGAVSARTVYSSLAAVVAALAAGAAALARWPQAFELDEERGLPWDLPLWSDPIWIQFAIAAGTALVCAGVARRRHSRAWMAALTLVLACDLHLALPYGVELTGVDATRIPGDAIRPSVHAARLAAGLSGQQQRLLAPAGTNVDAVVPGAFARVWHIPIAGGYGPMLLARHSALAMMGTNGSVDPLLLADDNAALDLLAVKFVVFRQEDFAASPTFVRNGITWASRPMDLPVGPSECGQRHARTVSYALPADLDITRIGFVARLRCSEDVPQGTEVARVRVVAGVDVYERPLLAGVDISDGGLADPNLRRRSKHGPAHVFDANASPYSSLTIVDVPVPLRAHRMQLDVTGTAGWMEIVHITLIDRSGRNVPVEAPDFLLDRYRWRNAAQFETSRITDRVADEEDRREQRQIVFENQRALPRAWIAREVVPLAEKEMLTAVHHSQLPDGRRFEAAQMALVYPGTVAPATYAGAASSAAVRSIGDGSIAVDVSTASGGFLVLSESHYPGWRARIGDSILPVHATDVSLQGVVVPPGRHVVEFELVSRTLRAGTTVSVLALAMLLLVVWRGVRVSSGDS